MPGLRRIAPAAALALLPLLGCPESPPGNATPPVAAAPSPDEILREALDRFGRGDRAGGLERAAAAFDAVAASGVQPADAVALRGLLERLLPLPPDEAPPRLIVNTTLALAALEGMAAARAPLAARVEERPDSFAALFALGALARAAGFEEPSRRWFERAGEAAPERHEPPFELGVLRAAAGDREGALERFDLAIARAPADADDAAKLRYYRGRVLSELGRTDEALEVWTSLAAGSGEFASRAANDLGVARLGRGDRDGALEAFLAAVDAAPDRPAPQLNAGSLLAELARGEEATPHLERARELRPEDPRPSTLLGQVAEDAGRDDDAEARYREALRRAPEYETARYRLSLLLRRTGREAEADALEAGDDR
ncbi:MAG: tetratricopeptide repeat protein [Planctomycetota bacterium JB042]